MANVLTSQRTYASYNNAVKALERALKIYAPASCTLATERWFIGISPNDRRFVPTLVGAEYAPFAGQGIMVIG